MPAPISNGLRITLFIHALVALVLGLLYLLIPRIWGEIVGWEALRPFDQRVIGAAFLGFALASWLAYRERDWQCVRIVVVMNLVFLVLVTLVMLWGIFTIPAMPALAWIYVVIVTALAVAFAVGYRGHASAPEAPPRV